MAATIKVLVMEEDRESRPWLSLLLDGSEGLQCVGFCEELACLPKEIEHVAPQVLLMDARCAAQIPRHTWPELRRAHPDLAIVLMDLEDGPRYQRLAKRAGADAFVSKARLTEELRDFCRLLPLNRNHRAKRPVTDCGMV